jgi:hypothetical protein
MATTRIKDLSKTATTVASDANIVIDGSSNGTQKITRDNFRQDTADAYVAAPSTYKLAPLNGVNKIDAAYLPTSGDTPKGEWNASTNSPTLADGTGTAGDYYDVTTAGTANLGSGAITYTVGDVVKYNGATWFKIDSVANILDGISTVDPAKAALQIPNVGTAANEVPLNGMLNSGAYLDFDAFYETGTFTPTIYYQNPTGLSTSYTTQSGNYVRLGDLICIQIKLTWTVTGTPINDNIGVGGIPFQPARVDSMMCHDSAGQSSFVITNAGNDILVCQSSSIASNLADNVGAGTHTIYISGTYQIA